MGFIKEPEGVDFVIKSKPLTDEERKAISEFINNRKKGNPAKRKAQLKDIHSSQVNALTKQ